MTAPRRILVPVGCGARSDEAVAHAVALARELDGELLLLGIVPLPALGPVILPPEPDGMAGHAAPADGTVLKRLRRAQAGAASCVRSRAFLRWGPAGPAIVDAAAKENVDLVVVPRERGGSLAHVLHDSPDRHVVQHSSVPVLVVPGDDEHH